MDHLSSCYFCGTALDEPLGTYRLSDTDSTEATVTLCSSCRQKLDTVLQTGDGLGIVQADDTPTPTGGQGTTDEKEMPDAASTEKSEMTGEDDAGAAMFGAEAGDDESLDTDGDEAGFETVDGDELVEEARATDIEDEEDEPGEDDTEETVTDGEDTSVEFTDDEDQLRDEMEPDIPDELAGSESDDDGAEGSDGDESPAEEQATTDDDADEVTADDVANLAGNVDTSSMDIGSGTTDEDSDESESDEEDDLKSAMEPTDFDSLAAEADEEESETTDDEKTEDDEEMESGEGADTEKEGEETDDDTEEERDVDPDVKAADDIATGKKDLEETIETEEDDQLKSKMEPDVPEELTTTDTAEDGGQLTEEATGDTATTQANGDGSNRQADEEQMDTGQTADDEQPDSSDNTPRTTVSALEYNKVMRLLQNREFPVERAEIEEVATSAYDLRESDCAEVIDLAVDRGLIDEQDGQLLRPE